MTIDTRTHTGTLNKSYTLTSLMAGAIGHTPTMQEEGGKRERQKERKSESEKAEFRNEVEVRSLLAET